MTASPLEPDVRKVPKRGLTSQIGLQKGSLPEWAETPASGGSGRCPRLERDRPKGRPNVFSQFATIADIWRTTAEQVWPDDLPGLLGRIGVWKAPC